MSGVSSYGTPLARITHRRKDHDRASCGIFPSMGRRNRRRVLGWRRNPERLGSAGCRGGCGLLAVLVGVLVGGLGSGPNGCLASSTPVERRNYLVPSDL